MAEELRKRNTDCVYFLASPLTCKKGFDCEYRHSEIVRLNPRDCYYWLAGNCLNAACGFRHPPLDGPAGKVLESSQCSVPVNKTNIPCYFYFNGFCGKGDTCSFLHGNDLPVAARSTKAGFPIGNGSSSKDKTASANKKGLTSTDVDAILHPSKKVAGPTIDVTSQHESLLQPYAENVSHQSQSTSAKISLPECVKVVVDETVSSGPAEGSNDSTSLAHITEDQSYEEQMTDSAEEENLWESSPGFDVVVGNGSENLDSVDDPECVLSTDQEERELDTELYRDNYEDPIAYESMHSDLELLYEREMHSYGHLESEPVLFKNINIISCSRGKFVNSMFSHKRKLAFMYLDSEEWNCAGRRSHLPRVSVYGNRSMIGLSRRRNGLSCQMSRNSLKPHKHGLYHPPPGRRLALQIGKLSRGKFSENLIFSNGCSRYESFRQLRQYKPCKHYDEYRLARRQQPLLNMSRKPVIRDHRFNPKSIPFKGPKSLSQIKEEKRKVEGNGGFSREKRRSAGFASFSADFRGPKPLSDILKDKRKVEELLKEMNT
ncbi:zinc finger CCCH domain-containing protein 34-like isoform X1 [Cucumis melo]|uniref:Zinc finger CCCH domain-containing protein 34-like isoform X1 n=1 Tax=Cucumis melo TaxID=3656 RepID=A0A1S3CPG0_CUCME|nr:zinc finger CCCH domain-containing protein 34-like isoform X1 [Cucumis melo]